MKKIYTLAAVVSLIGISASAQSNAPVDTLRRELVLEREYVPTGQQVKKAYFNPLDQAGRSPLKPLDFVRDSYQVGMNVRPILFDPIYNSNAPEFKNSGWYARLMGGFPGYFGLNTGVQTAPSESGVFSLSLNHLTKLLRTGAEAILPDEKYHSYETDIHLSYTHKIDDGILDFNVSGYWDVNSLYGIAVNTLPENSNIEKPFPDLAMRGVDFSMSKSEAPIEIASSFKYKAKLALSLSSKEDPTPSELSQGFYDQTGIYSSTSKKASTEVGILALGGLSYIPDDRWGITLDLRAETRMLNEFASITSSSSPIHGAATPYFYYTNDNFQAKLGASLQYINRGENNLLAAPYIELKYRGGDYFTLLAKADGGAKLHGMRELYKINPFYYGRSLNDAVEVAKYRIMLGAELGNLSGFSLMVRGGFADYSRLLEWAPVNLNFGDLNQYFGITTFLINPRKNIKNSFAEIAGRFVSPYNIEVGASLKLNNYLVPENEKQPSGLPKLNLLINGKWEIIPKLTLTADLNSMGGIVYYYREDGKSPVDLTEYSMPWISELNAAVAYSINNKIGVSLTGYNLLNTKNLRWFNYLSPGIGVMGAVTITM